MIRQEVLMLFVQGTKKILKNNLSKLIVYGYYARGDYKENSDIDVMILTPLSKEEIEQVENSIFDLAFDLELESGIVIQFWRMKHITDTSWEHCRFMIM